MKDKLYQNPKLEVRKSPLQGYGIFAKEDIKKGELLEECHYRVVEGYFEDEYLTKIMFFCEDGELPNGQPKEQMCVVFGYASLYNSATKFEDVNVYWKFKKHISYKIFVFQAIKDIKKDEELLHWYPDGLDVEELMIKFKPDLINYKEVEIIPEINQVFELDEEKLKWAIDEFEVELNWKDMWSMEDAKQRLKDGWYFNILEIDNKIVGWVWFNILENELCNLYVHKDYRNAGYGEQLIYSITNLVNKERIDIYSKIDVWNIKSTNVFKKCNWEESK